MSIIVFLNRWCHQNHPQGLHSQIMYSFNYFAYSLLSFLIVSIVLSSMYFVVLSCLTAIWTTCVLQKIQLQITNWHKLIFVLVVLILLLWLSISGHFLVSLTTLLCSVGMSLTSLLPMPMTKSPPQSSPMIDASTTATLPEPTSTSPSVSASPSRECRLCAQESDDVIDIFGKQGCERGLPEKVRLCLPVLVRMLLQKCSISCRWHH